MALSRLANGMCVANLHASTIPARASEELLAAAAHAAGWARGAPTILGGDFNLRPRTSPEIFRRLESEHGFGAPSGPDEIDHLLARGLQPAEPPRPWPPGRREIPANGLAIRLSDHAPVEGAFDRIAVT
jgi:endonuclease/exonuclease/phosphatase family metal-dependent hydrolase